LQWIDRNIRVGGYEIGDCSIKSSLDGFVKNFPSLNLQKYFVMSLRRIARSCNFFEGRFERHSLIYL